MSMRKPGQCFISTVTDPWMNLALEDWLFSRSGKDLSPNILLFYRNKPCVVIGRNQNPWRECNLKAMRKDRISLVRRRSGGGTVYHDMGNTNFSMIMPQEEFSRDIYSKLVARALSTHLDIPAEVNERHDVVVDRKKVSGSAYKLIKSKAYHHGTMLIDSELERLRSYLQPNNKNIVGRGVESVRSSVTRLREFSFTINHTDFCRAVAKEFGKMHNCEPGLQESMEELTIDTFKSAPEAQQTYEELRTTAWIYGQTPTFTHTITNDFFWGDLTVTLEVNEGNVSKISAVSRRSPSLAERIEQMCKIYIKQPYDDGYTHITCKTDGPVFKPAMAWIWCEIWSGWNHSQNTT